MIPAAFEYQRATSLDDAIARLQAADGAGRFLAGGHSLVPLMKLRLSEPRVLIDIARIPDFGRIDATNGRIRIGAGAVHHAVASSGVVREECPALSDAAAAIGDPQVRNRGTIGGSLAHADPSADYPAVLLALDADIHMHGPEGARVVKASAFFRDLFAVDLRPFEIITSVQVTPVRAAAYAKLYQRASHFAIVGVAAALDVRDGVIESARLGVTGAGPCARRLPGVEGALAGQPLSVETIARAAAGAGQELEHVNSDLHASEEYRRAMVPVFTRRALEGARARVAAA